MLSFEGSFEEASLKIETEGSGKSSYLFSYSTIVGVYINFLVGSKLKDVFLFKLLGGFPIFITPPYMLIFLALLIMGEF